MKILLDTHALLWYQDDFDRLSKKVKSLIRDEDNDVFVSIVSIWEIAIKSNLGKLALDFELTELKHMLKEYNFEILDLSIQHIEYL